MLYDPKWDQETKANPFTLDHLIAWLKTKPSDQAYCYDDNGHCLAAQYNKSLGAEYYVPCLPDHPVTIKEPFPVILEAIAVTSDWTFGAALERARFVNAGGALVG